MLLTQMLGLLENKAPHYQLWVCPNVILLDLMMPGMDGASFRAEQQKDPSLATIPVVVLSASSDIVRQADALGVQAHLKTAIARDWTYAAGPPEASQSRKASSTLSACSIVGREAGEIASMLASP